jgi:hypothetical protein
MQSDLNLCELWFYIKKKISLVASHGTMSLDQYIICKVNYGNLTGFLPKCPKDG